MKAGHLGLRHKLMITVGFAAMALIGALTVLWYAGMRTNERLVEQSSEAILSNALDDLTRRGELTLHFLARSLPNQVYFYDFHGLRQSIAPVLAQPDVRYITVFDPDGRILHDGTRALIRFGEPMDDPLAEEVIGADEPLALWTDELLDLSQPVMLGSDRIAGVRLGLSRAAADARVEREQAALAAQLQTRFRNQMTRLVIVFSALLMAAAIVAWMVGRGLLRPIRALAEAADRLGEGRFEGVRLEANRGDELGTLINGFNRMARALREHDRDIRRLAYQDPLTGLPNRLMFRELLDQTIAETTGSDERLGLLFIDLDDFKRINDTLGHDAGDSVLVEFAERLRRVLGGFEDTELGIKPIIARLGGDEFVALVSGREIRERCERLARLILENLGEPFEVGGQALFLSTSIGITLFPDDAHSSRHLLKCGDLAMYQAKLEGKNGVSWYRDHLTATAEERLQLEQDLRMALQEEQISVVYHPVVNMVDGSVVGAEALLRWKHPRLGEIPPERFVTVAEASSLINDLGRFVMLRACRDAAEWQRTQPGLRVGVNVSARQLLRRDLLSQVEEALAETGLPPDCLTLELTESSLLHDRALTAETLARLHAHGTHVWLDDFGTGFSGLSHLRQLRVRGVKIDRSFIADILDDPDDLALTSAIIAMAHSIGMQVVAEGVENTRQWTLLAERGCDYVQGFLLTPPLPAVQVPGFRPDPELLRAEHPGGSRRSGQ